MPEIINISELFRKDNMKKQHQFPVGSKVLIKKTSENTCWIEYLDSKLQDFINSNSSFFVVSHDRDCDGTPLYTLSVLPFKDGVDPRSFIVSIIKESFEGSSLDMSNQHDLFCVLTLESKIYKNLFINGISGDTLVLSE